MAFTKSRSFLYTLAKFLGDLSAIRRGKIGKSVARRITGKATGRGIGKLFR